MDPQEMNIFELKEYVNSLSNEELTKFADEYESDEIDVIELLNASRLYDYMQYKGKLEIEL